MYKCVYVFGYVQPKTIENDNEKYIGRPTHRKLSSSSTKGHKYRSKKNSKKRQTKPTSSQSRKSRHQRSPSKSRRGPGSSTSSRDVDKSEKGNNMKWMPDPDTMSSGEFERSLTKFFRKYVGQTNFMIIPYLIINFYCICVEMMSLKNNIGTMMQK